MSTVQPAEEINLHFTGDFHAMESAHNLLAAMTDNAVHRGAIPGLEAGGITWRRVTDAEDRGLRHIASGLGGNANGPTREAGFDISSASEIMAILALTSGYSDLRERLQNIVVGWTKDRSPVYARDVRGIGSMMALLRDAVKPNLAQTREGQPAIVHMGSVRQHRPRLQLDSGRCPGDEQRGHHGDRGGDLAQIWGSRNSWTSRCDKEVLLRARPWWWQRCAD